MTILPSAEENGKMVLGIFSHFKVQPDEVLMSNNFVAWAARNRIRIDNVKSGLDFALKEGWIAEGPNGSLALTRFGFDLM